MAIWRKGQSGNPAGRPRRESCIADSIRRILKEPDPDNPARTKMEALCDKVASMALAGDVRAMNLICDRLEGKAAQYLQTVTTDPVENDRRTPEERRARIAELFGIWKETEKDALEAKGTLAAPPALPPPPLACLSLERPA